MADFIVDEDIDENGAPVRYLPNMCALQYLVFCMDFSFLVFG